MPYAVQVHGLWHFFRFFEGSYVLVWSDNTSTVYHVNHQGGTRSSHSLQEAQRFLQWASPRLVRLGCRRAVSAEAPSGGVEAEPHSGSNGMGKVRQSRHRLTARCGFPSQNQPAQCGRTPWHTPPDCLLYAFPPIPLLRTDKCKLHSVATGPGRYGFL